MGRSMTRPKLKRDWVGRYVRTKREIETRGGTIFDAGEVFVVTRNFGGLHLEAVIQCEHCHRRSRRFVKGIPERDVVLLAPDYKPELKP